MTTPAEPNEIPAPDKRILMVGEGVTAAHVIRPLGIARDLDRTEFAPVFAADPRWRGLVENEGLPFEPLPCIEQDAFLKRLDRGAPLYTLEELQAYVQDDLRLIAKTKPDVIVGDFRISMGISAELSGIPYLALNNAHWSPNAVLPLPVPEHPLVALAGTKLAGRLIGLFMPHFLRVQARAMNRLRRWYGLAPLGGDGARAVYTCGARALYMDVPALYGNQPFAANEHWIGPVLWAPETALPDWWDALPTDRPLAWASAGSSGDSGAMDMAVSALRDAGFAVMVATAGRMRAPAGTYAAEFIPGLRAAARADLVVCNGGSGLVYQALACGKPVLGLPRNMDQYYVMEAVERQGAGWLLRSGTATAKAVAAAARTMLEDRAMRRSARELARAIAAMSPARRLEEIARETLSDGATDAAPAAAVVQPARWPAREPALAS